MDEYKFWYRTTVGDALEDPDSPKARVYAIWTAGSTTAQPLYIGSTRRTIRERLKDHLKHQHDHQPQHILGHYIAKHWGEFRKWTLKGYTIDHLGVRYFVRAKKRATLEQCERAMQLDRMPELYGPGELREFQHHFD